MQVAYWGFFSVFALLLAFASVSDSGSRATLAPNGSCSTRHWNAWLPGVGGEPQLGGVNGGLCRFQDGLGGGDHGDGVLEVDAVGVSQLLG